MRLKCYWSLHSFQLFWKFNKYQWLTCWERQWHWQKILRSILHLYKYWPKWLGNKWIIIIYLYRTYWLVFIQQMIQFKSNLGLNRFTVMCKHNNGGLKFIVTIDHINYLWWASCAHQVISIVSPENFALVLFFDTSCLHLFIIVSENTWQ